MGALQRWAARPVLYDWLSSYLTLRGLTRPIQLVMGTLSFTLLLMPAAATWGPGSDRQGPVATALLWCVGAAGIVAGILWLRRWPSRRQSLVIGLLCSGIMAVWGLLQHSPALTLLACATLTTSGSFFALLHPPAYVVYNLVVATVVGVVAAHRLCALEGFEHAALALWLVVSLNATGPFAVLGLIRAFGADLPHADHDSLTGLLNRRGLDQQLAAGVAASRTGAFLRITVIDLDDFKRVNDTYGHLAGDCALAAVAEIMREHAPTRAALCRTGGEEFLIADLARAPDPPEYVDQIRARIASLPNDVTASVGTACAELSGAATDGIHIAAAIDEADRAMYEAKRCGGNRVHHADGVRD